jgi:hypothetical protein
MLLTSTVAYEGMPKARGLSVKGIAILVAGLVLGSAIGFAVASFTSTTDAPTASAVAVEPWTVDPHFWEANVGSLEYLGLSYTEPSSGPR